MKDLKTGRITARVRVELGARRPTAPATTSQVDGACDRVAFTSDATNLAFLRSDLPKPTVVDSPLTGTQRRKCRKRTPHKPCKTRKLKVKSQRAPAVSNKPPAGTKQVYVRILGGQKDDQGLTGLDLPRAQPRAAGLRATPTPSTPRSASRARRARRRAGQRRATRSRSRPMASNLRGGDGNGVADVYESTLPHPVARVPRPAGEGPGLHALRSRGLCRDEVGRGGQRPERPAGDQPRRRLRRVPDGRDEPRAGDGNGVDRRGARRRLTRPVRSCCRCPSPPAARRGKRRLVRSVPLTLRHARHLSSPERDEPDRHPRAPTGTASRTSCGGTRTNRRLVYRSRDSDGRISGNAGNPAPDPCPNPRHLARAQSRDQLVRATTRPSRTATRCSTIPSADHVLPRPPRNPAMAATRANSEPGLHQIYLRFVGPCGSVESAHGGRAQSRAPARQRQGQADRRRRCARASAGAGRRAPRSTTSPRRPASRAACCTTTSGRRNGCSSRSCGTTRTCACGALEESARRGRLGRRDRRGARHPAQGLRRRGPRHARADPRAVQRLAPQRRGARGARPALPPRARPRWPRCCAPRRRRAS